MTHRIIIEASTSRLPNADQTVVFEKDVAEALSDDGNNRRTDYSVKLDIDEDHGTLVLDVGGPAPNDAKDIENLFLATFMPEDAMKLRTSAAGWNCHEHGDPICVGHVNWGPRMVLGG